MTQLKRLLDPKRINIRIATKNIMGDVHSPVSVYLKLRQHYSELALLESNDFAKKENCNSFVAVDPISSIRVWNDRAELQFPDDAVDIPLAEMEMTVPDLLHQFMQAFDIPAEHQAQNGLLGHTNFEAFQYFDPIELDSSKSKNDLPDINYSLFRFLIYFDHYKDMMHVLENIPPGEKSNMPAFLQYLNEPIPHTRSFELAGTETSNVTDDTFKNMVRQGIEHCQIGDVFQLVLSRQYHQPFAGDEFNVYRTLRTINPSPYLFFFDLGTYKIMGSSPESQLIIKDNLATVNPIAGTYKRTGNFNKDIQAAKKLKDDPKEKAEHIMLVDLARNDLGRHTDTVYVEKLKEVHFYSHVIHLVSKVQGYCAPGTNPIRIFADTFPAGTLSGAPKYKAISLIDAIENEKRQYYGGAIGMFSFNGDINQAILIRSFLSYKNILTRQAGAGIVVSSNPESELQEVENKLGALKKALIDAVQMQENLTLT